jgi:hypothetical protein
MSRKKEYIVEWGSTFTGKGRVYIADIYESWNRAKEKPEGLVTTYFHHEVKRVLYDARKHITKAQAKRIVECVQNRQARMIITHTGFALWGGRVTY